MKKGETMSDEQRARIAASLRGHRHPPEVRAAISEGMRRYRAEQRSTATARDREERALVRALRDRGMRAARARELARAVIGEREATATEGNGAGGVTP